ncbi:uncharacterized protein [Aegilops tauschii subsp. strangulata]|uniref:uncharacterized protein isoform X2 n=1 Tax=Aegilops tauschii subsp. strangulata TaxID=200361 RepID=UPI001ABCD4DA|nr:uncharacterized protein LOC120975604 isoform X2 [Aegilops tauschii subsp. strangulata]
MGGGGDGSESSSGGGFPGWSCSSSLAGSSRGAAILVADSMAGGQRGERGTGQPRCRRSDGRSPAPAVAWPRIRDLRMFPQEVWQRGEPEMRPECGRVVIARTAGMVALERDFYGRVLYATIIGQPRSVVMPEALAAAMESHCVVRRKTTKDFFSTLVKLLAWQAGKLEYKTLLSLERLLEEAWDAHTVNLVLAGVDGELIDMLPATDKWVLPVTAWLRNPSGVPKVLTVSVPTPPTGSWKPDSNDENAHSPPAPNSPTERATVDFPVIMHVKEVVDRGPLLTEGLAVELLPDEDEDITWKHTFTTWCGKIDGTGPGQYGKA